MRWRVTILRQTSQTDGLGGQLDSWTVRQTVAAEKIHRSEDERYAAAQRYESRLVTFRLWWTADLFATDRLRCDGVVFDIKGIRELGFRRGLDVAAEARL
jgi:SPP1 family predicted phage head-tail adaptor